MSNGALPSRRWLFCQARFGVPVVIAICVLGGSKLNSSAADQDPQKAAANSQQAVQIFNQFSTAMQPKRPWSAEQVEGPPNVPMAGDSQYAWASLSQDDQPEWLSCEYRSAVTARSVSVYENLAPGTLVKVTAFNSEGKEVIAWEGKDPTPRTAQHGVSLIPVRLSFPVQKIKLYLDSPAVPNWNEIDAVGLEDGEGTTHWAASVKASSTWGAQPAFNANMAYTSRQACGEPDTFMPGDRPTAWASASPDGRAEWLLLEFEKTEKPFEVVVHENNSPGAINKITVFDPDNKEVVAWEGADPTPSTEPWGVSIFPINLDFPVSKIKLHIDSMTVKGFNEIDAVALRSANRTTQWAKDATASSTFGIGMGMAVARNMGGMMPQNPFLQEIMADLKQIKEQVDELKKVNEDLTKQIEQLNEKAK